MPASCAGRCAFRARGRGRRSASATPCSTPAPKRSSSGAARPPSPSPMARRRRCSTAASPDRTRWRCRRRWTISPPTAPASSKARGTRTGARWCCAAAPSAVWRRYGWPKRRSSRPKARISATCSTHCPCPSGCATNRWRWCGATVPFWRRAARPVSTRQSQARRRSTAASATWLRWRRTRPRPTKRGASRWPAASAARSSSPKRRWMTAASWAARST